MSRMRPIGSGRQLGPAAPRSDGERLAASITVRYPRLLATLAVLALASNALLGFLGIAAFIGCAGLALMLNPMFNLRQLLRFAPLMILPVLAILSTIWSDAPSRTMRAGLELFLTFAAAVVIARNLSRERMVLAFFLAYTMLAASTLPWVPITIATKFPLVAMLGSKNQAGFAGYALFAMAVTIIADPRQSALLRVTALLGLPLGLLVAVLAQSGGTTAALAVFLLVFPSLALLGFFKLPVRVALVAAALMIAAAGAFFADDITAAVGEFRTSVLQKDATLTGRTYLWEVAGRLAERRPWLGYGYGAFWRQGNIEAEGLWRWAGIASRSGFNFHNLFVGMQVDMGLVGVVVLAVTAVVVMLVALSRQIAQPAVAMAGLTALSVVLYARSYVEEGLVAPFSMPTLIWLVMVVYAVAGDDSAARAVSGDRPATAPAKPVPTPRAAGVRRTRRVGSSPRKS